MKKKEIIKYILELLCVVVVTTVIFHTILLPVHVEGDSMYPTLHDGDVGIISSSSLKKEDIKRFDIVVLDCKQIDKNIVKRVIGLPGENIVYSNDKLYINGVYYKESFLDKDYIKEAKTKYNSTNFTNDFEITVGKNQIFVLGDNRLRSADSRTFGSFSYDDIEGKKGLILFPFNHMKWMD